MNFWKRNKRWIRITIFITQTLYKPKNKNYILKKPHTKLLMQNDVFTKKTNPDLGNLPDGYKKSRNIELEIWGISQ